MISTVIITYNEEERIETCIASVLTFSDEVIVVDRHSSDKTVDIAMKLGAKVILEPWKGYGHARNLGASTALNDWIFSIDADEYCTQELQTQLEKIRLEKGKVYKVQRRNIYRGREMKYGMLRPEWKPRLYHRDESKWSVSPVHETLVIDKLIDVHKLDGSLLHHTYDSHADHLDKLKLYAQLNDRPSSPLWKRASPYFHFVKDHFFHLGMLEGQRGWETSRATFLYHKWKLKQKRS